MLPRHRVVYDLQDGLEVGRVDLFILASDVQGCYAEALQVGFPKLLPFLERLVNDAYCYKERLGPHLELVVQLCEPVDEVLSVLVCDLHLQAPVQEVARVQVPLFFLLQVYQNLGDEFYN